MPQSGKLSTYGPDTIQHMLVKIRTSVLCGLEAQSVEVEVQGQNGLPRFVIIGLADSAVKESRDRVIAALHVAGCSLPDQILINLSPAEIPKAGTSMDLAMAVAVAAAGGSVDQSAARDIVFVGELGLDGAIKPVRGVIAHAILAKHVSATAMVVPAQAASEASLVSGLSIIPVGHINELLEWLRGDRPIASRTGTGPPAKRAERTRDPFIDVIGQESAKRALMIAAAGGHHLLMAGTPGCGKTMLASAFPGILPPLTESEILEVAAIHSIAAQNLSKILRSEPPVRAPHYSISEAGLLGGGSQVRPGEISLAHRGVLFLDELPEFCRGCLEGLRIPLEEGEISVVRARHAATMPARFQLIAAMNPCPCGRSASNRCSCSVVEIQRYVKKLSQPILDRIDLHTALHPVPLDSLWAGHRETTIQDRAGAVARAREFSTHSYGMLPSSMSHETARELAFSPEAKRIIERISSHGALSARGFHRLLRVSCTIASLRETCSIEEEDVLEAYGLRIHHAESIDASRQPEHRSEVRRSGSASPL